MNGWYRYLPLWAKVYWRTSAGDARVHLPWPGRIRKAGGAAWVTAYMRWKHDGYPD